MPRHCKTNQMFLSAWSVKVNWHEKFVQTWPKSVERKNRNWTKGTNPMDIKQKSQSNMKFISAPWVTYPRPLDSLKLLQYNPVLAWQDLTFHHQKSRSIPEAQVLSERVIPRRPLGQTTAWICAWQYLNLMSVWKHTTLLSEKAHLSTSPSCSLLSLTAQVWLKVMKSSIWYLRGSRQAVL